MKRSLKKLLATTFLFTAMTLPAVAQDADLQSLVDRLERMDRDIKALNLKVYRGGVPANTTSSAEGAQAVTTASGQDLSGPLGARLSIRVNELENQMRQMTGQLEETAYRISQLNTRLDKLVADVDYRLTTLEGGNPSARPDLGNTQGLQGNPTANDNKATNQLTPPSATGSQPGTLGTLNGKDLENGTSAPTSQTPSTSELPSVDQPSTDVQTVDVANLSPEDAYQQSRQMLMKGDFAGAEGSFKSFLETNKDHKLAGNVRYWLGETYYVQGDYNRAAATFLEGYQKDERGAKAPDSLLKLGMALIRLDKKPEACATFTRLRSAFPTMPAHLSKTLERERASAKCG